LTIAGSGGVLVLVLVMVTVMVMTKGCVALGATPLLAVSTPLKLPAVVGVPSISPELALSTSPGGSAPLLMLKVGAGNPLAVSVKL
jgi:hypothetical protein